ncbi:phage tail tape measure protein [Rhizobium rhizosphaerae]|uniref:Phage tail tape measure protein n=1 Tax=Xaviernesmea rhizosphaerae TaxID=1672749 RepID=A0A1Q9ANB2_9HYPH|nr:phage tail tape measure protein [Xaviernesmea rhizosphaerae]OLP56826.1 phage tail tape measure protein [Xaviernesmea rhizosphaerae]
MANRKIKAELEFQGRDNSGPAFRSVALRMGQVERQMAQFNRTAASMDRRIGEITKRTGAVQRAAQGVETAMSGVKTGLGALAAYGVGKGIKDAVFDFAAAERQMTRMGTTSGATAEEMESAFADMQRIAKDLRYDSVAPAVEAMDTMVASGKSIKESLEFLPSVLATAQASGAATNDIANTGLKTASALGIEARNMQDAFDVMVTGGKAGQFELKAMSQYIPGLANSFASLGYKGESGLKQLVAILQTIREDTGDDSSAATYAQNVFAKIYSTDNIKKFKDLGIDLNKELDDAARNGEDVVSAFTRISNESIKGDLKKLPQLFTDEQFRLGMQSLITSQDSLKRFLEAMNAPDVKGTVWRDVQRVMHDTQASIDALSNSWSQLKTAFGKGVAINGGTEAIDALTGVIDYHTAVNRGLEKNGVNGFWNRTKFGLTSDQIEKDRMAIAGGYKDPAFVEDYNKRIYEAQRAKPSVGRHSSSTPVPAKPEVNPAFLSPDAGQAIQRFFSPPSADQVRDALKIVPGKGEREWERAGENLAEGGREAGKHIDDSASAFRVAGYDVAAAISRAAQALLQAGRSSMAFNSDGSSYRPRVNADTGRSMPPTTFGPAGGR